MEEKELFQLAKLWRKYYYRSKKQDGELPVDFNLTPEEQNKKEREAEDAENVTFVNLDEDESEKPTRKYEFSEKIQFYKENKGKLFSFAKDQLESIIIQQAENLRVRGRLSFEMEKSVKEIIPDYEPLRENKPGVDLRPEKLPKRKTESLPKLPKMPC